ncbi:MAG: hypothetical protein ACREUF_03575 [Solimonas sp.]
MDVLPGLTVARDLRDLRILEDADLEPGSFLGLLVEPKAGVSFWIASMV